MGNITSLEEYIALHPQWIEELRFLSSILEETEMTAAIKWNAPVYTVNGKNVVGLGAFKQHYGIWFFNGVFLKDPKNVLINAQEEKTKALRQMRFEKGDHIDRAMVKAYLLEAIENEKLGKRLAPKRDQTNTIDVPDLLNASFTHDSELHTSFKELSPFKQKEYCEYIDSAKRETTKQSRLEKIIPMIKSGIGLNDKYRK